MRYIINYYDKPSEIVNTDKRFKERQRVIGNDHRSTIDPRTRKTARTAKVARSFHLPRFKSVVYAGLILAVIMWVAPRVRYGAPVEAHTEQTQEAKTADLPPSITPIITPEPDLYAKYFGDEANIARAICLAENGTQQPDRVSGKNKDGSRDHGLCQINDKWQRDKFENVEQLHDPEFNIKVAKQIRDEWGNWNAWTTYRTGAYKKNLK